MANSKIYKIIASVFLLLVIVAAVTYSQLNTRHRAIVKTTLLHKLHLVDSKWVVNHNATTYAMISPSFLLDGIYKSMEGPKSSKYVQLSQDSTLLWMTGFKVTAIDAKSLRPLSNEYICHTNIDFNDVKYYSNFHLPARIGVQYPRMTSLSNGMESQYFPKGYGVPMFGNDFLYVTTQSLNHNNSKIKYLVKHKVDIEYSKSPLKPLMSRTAFIMLPFDNKNPYHPEKGSEQCIPVETKNHTYDDGKGNKMSGHWIVPMGKSIYSANINGQLLIKDSLRLHAAALHVHPYATSLVLRDKTSAKDIFRSDITNAFKKTGLLKVPDFSSEKGVWLFENHDYELILDVDNTSSEKQDMMASTFLFFYDKELDSILNKKVDVGSTKIANQ